MGKIHKNEKETDKKHDIEGCLLEGCLLEEAVKIIEEWEMAGAESAYELVMMLNNALGFWPSRGGNPL